MARSPIQETHPVAVIGAGIGGLSAAIRLASAGRQVFVYEARDRVGGKAFTLFPDSKPVYSGPTVLTLRHVFDELFEAADAALDDYLTISPLAVLARHFWPDGSRLDLHADCEQSTEAIRAFAGDREADGYQRFSAHARSVFQIMDTAFMQAQRPGPLSLAWRVGLTGLPGLIRSRPFSALWKDLHRFFHDPRLLQLFARYATYVGSSPFKSPAVLALFADAEAQGVWTVQGGIPALANAMRRLASDRGVNFLCDTPVEQILLSGKRVRGVITSRGEQPVSSVIYNGDMGALSSLIPSGQTGIREKTESSLSAVTFSLHGRATGRDLSQHNVFFSPDYAAEFELLAKQRRLPRQPTVYVCAQNRNGHAAMNGQEESLFILANAPAMNTRHTLSDQEISRYRDQTFSHLSNCGVQIDLGEQQIDTLTPARFADRFPGSGGALYGLACHGPLASFRRPGARTRVGGLFLAGGGIHPGPGVPMVAISGRLAAEEVLRCPRST